MNLTTKTLASIMVIAMLTINASPLAALSPKSSQSSNGPRRQERQLERMYRHHDKDLKLRASVLGINPTELRERLKTESFSQVTKKAGFKDRQAFHTALVGRLKIELRERGWSDNKISSFVKNRFSRYT